MTTYRTVDLIGLSFTDVVLDSVIRDHDLKCCTSSSADPRNERLADNSGKNRRKLNSDLVLLVRRINVDDTVNRVSCRRCMEC